MFTVDYMVLYVRNTADSTRKFWELIDTCGKMTEYKTTQKSVARDFLKSSPFKAVLSAWSSGYTFGKPKEKVSPQTQSLWSQAGSLNLAPCETH